MGIVFCHMAEDKSGKDYTSFGRRHRVYGGLFLITPDGVTRCRLSVSMVIDSNGRSQNDERLLNCEWDAKAGACYSGTGRTVYQHDLNSYANIMGFDVHVISALAQLAFVISHNRGQSD